MSVRFVIGRAGSGKTHRCLSAIREELGASAADGPRLVLLVPEQASLQMERELVCAGDVQAISRAEVLSFRRLTFRIMQQANAPLKPALSPAARAMVLRTIIARLGSRLKYYRRVDRMSGFFDRLGQTIGELIDEAVGPEGVAVVGAVAGDDPRRAEKFADLALIYAAYLEHLGDHRVDASQHLQIARQQLAGCDYLRGAHLWVDGFAGFTRQEMLLLAEVARRSEHVEITALVDPAYAQQTTTLDDVYPADLFAKTQRTCFRLRAALVDAGLTIDAPVLLDQPPPRFANSGDLAALESSLCGPNAPMVRSTAPADIRLIEAADRRAEARFAVNQVVRMVRSGAGRLRYRDVAFIVRDLEPYHDLLSAALIEHHVPYFIDRRKSANHHPLVEFLRAALAMAIEPYSLEAVRQQLKTGMIELSEADADELENYLLAYGITGRDAWTEGDWTFFRPRRGQTEPDDAQKQTLERVNRSRRRVIEAVDSFIQFAAVAHGGADWATALRSLLDANSADARISAWAAAADKDGDITLADQHRQVSIDVAALLEDVATALHDTRMSAAEFASVLEAGLSQMTLGLVPPTVDQVLVGSIERSRHPDLKVVVLLGFNDGVFPRIGADHALLTDEDREALAARNLVVGVSHRQQVLEERLLFYIAATRPSHRLIITWASSDGQGRAQHASPYVATLQQLFPALAIERTACDGLEPEADSILSVRDLAAGLALAMRVRSESNLRSRWNDLYEAARRRIDLAKQLQPVLASLDYENQAMLSKASVARLFGETYRASVSELETFAACPFQRFAQYGLRLQEREEAQLQATDVGTIHHAILEDFINELVQRGQRLSDLADDDIGPRLERCAQRIGAEREQAGGFSTARDAYLFGRSATDLSLVVRSQRRVAAAGAFRPRAAEATFGYPDGLPALALTTPKGRRVELRGFIDRVDLAEVGDELLGIVIDYKRTRDKRLDLAHVYHGLSLQLLGYLLVLAERGQTLAGRPIVPVGAFYVSLLSKYQSVDHPDDAPDSEDDADAPTPRGILNAARIAALDHAAPDERKSKLFKFHRNKDGSLGYIDTHDAAEPKPFAALLANTRQRLGELADRVLDGDIAVSPFRLRDFSPCQWCRMQSVCRFEFGDPGMRHLDALTRSQVFERIQKEGA